MTRKELAETLYELKKDNLPNVIGLNRPLTKKEFVYRHLNGCGCAKGFSKEALESLVERAKARA